MPSITGSRAKCQSLLLGTGSVALLSLGGCATIAPPDAQIATAENEVRQAESLGAQQYAQQSYNLAKDKLEEARKAYQEEEFLKAQRLAEKAAADATLAQVTTNNRQLKSAIDKLTAQIDALEKELKKKSS